MKWDAKPSDPFDEADNKDAVLQAHAKALAGMTQSELGKLFVAMGPGPDRDDWFRELIVEQIKRTKP